MLTYKKRKNAELFQSLERSDLTFISSPQNYIPIYKRFFSLNESNFNHINLNHKWFLSNVREKAILDADGSDGSEADAEAEADGESNDLTEYIPNVYVCTLKNSQTNKTKVKYAFLKMAPLLDPYKLLIGKYNTNDPHLFSLPTFEKDSGNPILNDVNNAAYVDGLFCFLSSQLLHLHDFSHGLDYYGSFLAIKHNFTLDIYDDLEYLNQSDYFMKNKNVLFQVDEYPWIQREPDPSSHPPDKLPAIHINQTDTCHSRISVGSIQSDMYGTIFEDYVSLHDVKTKEELEDITHLVPITHPEAITIKSHSTCSSRTSYTDESFAEKNSEKNSPNRDDADADSDVDADAEDYESSEDEEYVEATIPKFPVQVICMEYCQDTLDDLLLHDEINEDELFSALMQIIMILCTYQKVFYLTHNDLHTNNVMYVPTERKFLYYCFRKTYYKVPTYGKLYKIIDYGRAIFKYNGKLFCSNSFQHGNDASTQYNTEPYFNENKPRLEPNYSFDITRLACSLYDYVVDDPANRFAKARQVIEEWCMDDKGINLLYKATGEDRYPRFKLYKMIARCVHNHTPQTQLDRPEFSRFAVAKSSLSEKEQCIDLDAFPCYV